MSDSERTIDDKRTIDDELTDFGVAVVGNIDLKLVGKVKAQLESPEIKQRHHRQTELRWNSACDAIERDFDTVSERPKYISCPNGMIETETEHHTPMRQTMPEPPICLLSQIPDRLWHL